MARTESVNVWYDRPANFLEVFWGYDDGSGNNFEPDSELYPTLFLDSSNLLAGFHIIGALKYDRGSVDETYYFKDSPSHPLTIRYDLSSDLWDIQWGPEIVDFVDSPNPRIKAKVDAEGQIRGVLVSGLRTFEDEILNQDLYPVQRGTPAT